MAETIYLQFNSPNWGDRPNSVQLGVLSFGIAV